MSARGGDRGFVLVGVVMFVLALTILSMSLYALSGYEIGFFGQSRSENSALYKAEGGIEMARELLANSPYRLDMVHALVGIENVSAAMAYQSRDDGSTDSVGVIQFASAYPVRIVVTATVDGVSRTVSSEFVPNANTDYYKRLFTVAGTHVSQGYTSGLTHWYTTGSIWVEPNAISEVAGTRLNGVQLGVTDLVWHESADTSWAQRVTWGAHPPIRVGPVPVPDLASYYASHPAASLDVPAVSNDTLVFDTHSIGTVGYYGSPPGSSRPGYSYYTIGGPHLYVQGSVVWVLPRGLRTEQTVHVHPIPAGAPATLVIVGSPGPGRPVNLSEDPDIGLWFWIGLDADPSVNVVLVSDGQVNLERNEVITDLNVASLLPHRLTRLSVFCNALFLQGPWPFGLLLRDYYSHPPDMDAVIDELQSQDALPSIGGAPPQSFQFVAGSWRDLSP